MGAGQYFANWLDHALSTNRKASMKFGEGAWVVKLPEHYIIGNTKTATECWISGHGGSNSGDYLIDNGTFSVPSGCSVQFFQPHGYCLIYRTNNLRTGKPIVDNQHNDTAFGAGEACTNYILNKFEGRHNQAPEDAKAERGYTYEALQSICDEGKVVVVTIRNRWYSSHVTLEETIKAIRKVAPNITKFNCLFCRVDDDYEDDDPAWNAGTGRWVS